MFIIFWYIQINGELLLRYASPNPVQHMHQSNSAKQVLLVMVPPVFAATGMGSLARMVMAASLPIATFLAGLTRHHTEAASHIALMLPMHTTH